MHSPKQTMKKAFHGRMIVPISRPTHACSHALLVQERLIALTRVGIPTIRVME
jgi:hypothetical protein